MARIRLWQILILVVIGVAALSTFVGYLDARDGVPAPSASALEPRPEPASGFVIETGDDSFIVQFDDNTRGQFETGDIATLLESRPAERDVVIPGSVVIAAVEADDFGARAFRVMIVVAESLVEGAQ